MTREEAREILSRVRSLPASADDPDVIAALKFAETDPDLARWFREQQAFHDHARRELRAIQPPPDLKARILANPPRRRLISRSQLLALAASLALMIGATMYFLRPSGDTASFANFHSRMTSFALRTYQMDIITNNAAEVHRFLASRGGPANFPLPSAVAKLPVKGGGRLAWQNHPVSMICFELPTKETLFMFVIDRHLAPGAPREGVDLHHGNSLSTAAWNQAGRVYLIAANADAQALAALAPQN